MTSIFQPRGCGRSALITIVDALFLLWALLPAVAEEKPVVIRLWDQHVHDKKFRQAIFKEFNKANPDIKVEYTSQVTSSYVTVLDAAFRVGSPPEIFVYGGTPGLAKLAELGWILPLEDVAPSKEAFQKSIAGFPKGQQPFVENINVLNGRTYSWPTSGTAGSMMIYWNTMLFREAGLKGTDGGEAVPETWGDMRQFAKKITELGQGKVFGIVHGIKNPGVWDFDIFCGVAASTIQT